MKGMTAYADSNKTYLEANIQLAGWLFIQEASVGNGFKSPFETSAYRVAPGALCNNCT